MFMQPSFRLRDRINGIRLQRGCAAVAQQTIDGLFGRMALQFPVRPGTILLCDYSAGGFRPPEMIKLRPAVVISPRLPHRDGLCAVVPLSTTAPAQEWLPYVCRLELSLPAPFDRDSICWAKADMIATVSFSRLNLFRTRRDASGKRKYLHLSLSEADLARVRAAVLHGLGLA